MTNDNDTPFRGALRAMLHHEDPEVRLPMRATVALIDLAQIGGISNGVQHLIAQCMSSIRSAREMTEARTVADEHRVRTEREMGMGLPELEAGEVMARAQLVDRALMQFVRACAAELGLDVVEPGTVSGDEWQSVLRADAHASRSPRDAARGALAAIGKHVPNGCRN